MSNKLKGLTMLFRRIRMWLGKIGFDFCETCGRRNVFDEKRFMMGYGARTDCPHCDHLDRFDIPEKANLVYGSADGEIYRRDLKGGWLGKRKNEVHYIQCLDCGVGLGATDPEVWKSNRRNFVKAHWGHNKEEM